MVRGLLVAVLLTVTVVSALTMLNAGGGTLDGSKSNPKSLVAKQGFALDSEAKQYLTIAFKTAQLDTIDQGGAFATGGALARAIQASEPGLKVVVGDAVQLTKVKTPPATIAVDPDSSETRIVLLSRSKDGTVWRLRAEVTGAPIIDSVVG